MLKIASIISALVLSSCALTSETTDVAESASTTVSAATANAVYGCAEGEGFRCMCGERFLGCFTSIDMCLMACDMEQEVE
jgi:hypothetical protein